jgi:hypothetical protein
VIEVETDDPRGLILGIAVAVANGTVTPWRIGPENLLTFAGGDVPPAWFRPEIRDESAAFFIVRPLGESVSLATYAAYHAGLAEMLLEHFDAGFRAIRISSLAADGDLV